MSTRSDAIIAAYLAEIERTAGPKVAGRYHLYYESGWAHLRLGSSRRPACYRLSKIETFTSNLKERKDWEGDE